MDTFALAFLGGIFAAIVMDISEAAMSKVTHPATPSGAACCSAWAGPWCPGSFFCRHSAGAGSAGVGHLAPSWRPVRGSADPMP